MFDALNTALGGLRAAEARAFQAATNIAQVRPPEAELAADSASGATTGVVFGVAPEESPITGGGHPNAEARDFATDGGHDLATEIVSLAIAQHAYEANLAVVRTADDMLSHLVDAKI